MANNPQARESGGSGTPLPRHVAIIMDGNGRWAGERGLPRAMGHRAGVEAVQRAVRAAIEIGIPYLTIYSFSSENWTRPPDEVDYLMYLMKRFIRRDLAELHHNKVRIRVIGERERVDPDMLTLIDEACELTKANTGLTLVIAFNYGSRFELAKAARHLAMEVKAGGLSPEDITPDLISQTLDTSDFPDPDLLIRTSGEMRLSNFLLWQCAYAELVFLDVYWPDFTREHFDEAVAVFRARDRRFGGLTTKASTQGARDAG